MGKQKFDWRWFDEMKHTHYGHSATKDADSYHILIYLADYALEERQGADMH